MARAALRIEVTCYPVFTVYKKGHGGKHDFSATCPRVVRHARPKPLSFHPYSATSVACFPPKRVLLKAPINGMKVRPKRSRIYASRTNVHAKRMKVHGQVSREEANG
jgi:hypothetical protein